MAQRQTPGGRSAPPLARHALITGGSSGIGFALARALAARGAAVSLVARDPDRLAAAADALRAARPAAAVSAVPADVTDARAAAAALAAAEAAHGPADLVAACAGGVRAAPFHDLAPEDFRALMELNYFGVLNILRPALAGMRARGAGRALIVGSAAGLAGIHGYAAYAPTKFALRGLAEALRAEHAPHGVQVAIAHPPDTDTPQLAAERAERPAETAALAGAAGAWAADAVAEAILRGLARGRADIPVGRAAWALLRLAPAVRPWLDLWLDRVAARARRG
jgi:3-dehydrosphinganine reductase